VKSTRKWRRNGDGESDLGLGVRCPLIVEATEGACNGPLIFDAPISILIKFGRTQSVTFSARLEPNSTQQVIPGQNRALDNFARVGGYE
jgi:hypothetical protein